MGLVSDSVHHGAADNVRLIFSFQILEQRTPARKNTGTRKKNAEANIRRWRLTRARAG